MQVVGAGRGPLVKAALRASKTTKRPLKVFAVEKVRINNNDMMMMMMVIIYVECQCSGNVGEFVSQRSRLASICYCCAR